MEQKMFQKKEYVFAENLGVCRVEEITNLVTKDQTVMQYYGLKSIDKDSKTGYFPVEDRETKIRELIDLEQAKTIIEKYENDNDSVTQMQKKEADFVIALDEKIKEKQKKR